MKNIHLHNRQIADDITIQNDGIISLSVSDIRGMVFRAHFEDPKFLAQRMQNRSRSSDKGITDVSFHITNIRLTYEYCNALFNN